jgi:hypothetical protein
MSKEAQAKNRAQWQERIEAQKQSGLSQRAFCEQNHLLLAQFNYYRSRFEKKEKASPSSFAPIQVAKRDSEVNLRISLPNSFHIEIPAGIAPLYVKRLVEVLVSC